ncbi:MAG TPA: glycosyltransferase [Micromonosporaceae bacterium]|nr:glycosyltransferase [Micromonosporaceae bacterium]
MTSNGARVLVVVGTDTHPFDRLTDWLEQWYCAHPGPPDLVVQYGHGRAPGIPGATPFLDHEALKREMAEATLVVSHGGPATILEARRSGHLPIVVPRDPAHGEHVDDHQQLFARRLGSVGMVHLCDSVDALTTALADGLADPRRFTIAGDPDAAIGRAAAVARVGSIVEDLISARGRRGFARRRSG